MLQFIGVRIIKEMPGSVESGTHCIFILKRVRKNAKSDCWLRHGLPSVWLSVRPSVRPSPWNNSALIGRIFMKFDIFVFFRKYVEKVNVWLKSDKNNVYFN